MLSQVEMSIRHIMKITSKGVSMQPVFRTYIPSSRVERTRFGPVEKSLRHVRARATTKDKNKLTFPFHASVGGRSHTDCPNKECSSLHREYPKASEKPESHCPVYRKIPKIGTAVPLEEKDVP